MRAMPHAGLAIVGFLLFGSVGAAAGDWKSILPKDGRIRLAVGGGVAEAYYAQTSRDFGNIYYCEFGEWGFKSGQHQVEAQFCWTDDLGGWEKDAQQVDDFFPVFAITENPSHKANATPGPTVETVLGEVKTLAFDVELRTFAQTDRECIGFTYAWDRGTGVSWNFFARVIDLYACAKDENTLTEEDFRRVLSGFSIEGEFDALIEDKS